MINYQVVEMFLRRRFGMKVGLRFGENSGTIIFLHDVIDEKAKIQSGEFIVEQEGLRLLLWYEFPEDKSPEYCKSIEEKMNSLLVGHCFDFKFIFKQDHRRKFLGAVLKLLMPSPNFVEGELLNAYSASSIIYDFLTDFVWYAPIWHEGVLDVKHISRGITQNKIFGQEYLYSSSEEQLLIWKGAKFNPIGPEEETWN